MAGSIWRHMIWSRLDSVLAKRDHDLFGSYDSRPSDLGKKTVKCPGCLWKKCHVFQVHLVIRKCTPIYKYESVPDNVPNLYMYVNFQASDCLQCIKELAVWTGIANMSKLECSLSLQNIPVDPENKCLGIAFKALKNGGASVSLFVSDVAIIYWYGGWSGKTDISSSEFFYK